MPEISRFFGIVILERQNLGPSTTGPRGRHAEPVAASGLEAGVGMGYSARAGAAGVLAADQTR